jgi:hypothetical protein
VQQQHLEKPLRLIITEGKMTDIAWLSLARPTFDCIILMIVAPVRNASLIGG